MKEDTVSLQDCKRKNHRNIMVLLAIAMIVVLFMLISIAVGMLNIPISRVVECLFHKDSSTEGIIIWEWRLPIAVGSVMVGMALGVAGTVMQCILKNPLGSPYTLGLSNAAALGASIGILVTTGSINLGYDSPIVVTIFAFLFSMIATGFIIVMAKYTSISPEAMVLAGVALSSIFSAACSALQYFASDSELASIVYWTFGDVTKLSWTKLGIMFFTLVPCVAYFYYKRWDYNALDAGDMTAKCLGINIDRTRIMGLVLSSVVTSVAVSCDGVIGFVGLLGPHLVRRMIGSDHRFLIPGSMIVGALILLVSNFIGQNAFTFVMPVGIITSFLGGPLFLIILLKSYRTKRC